MIRQFNTETPPPDTDDHEHRLASSIRRRAQDTDRYVGARMRQRRIMLGLSQREMAALIGVTFQQACKYENGSNRVSSGRLYRIAQALDTEVGYFFEGIGKPDLFRVTQQQRLFLDLVRNFTAIPNRRHREEIASLARAPGRARCLTSDCM